MERDCLILAAIWEARKEIHRTGKEDELQMIDLMNMAVDYGKRDNITFEEIDELLDQTLIEIVCF